MEGWRSPNLTFSTIPINLEIDTHPTKGYELTHYPARQTHTTLHKPDGTTICTIENKRLEKLRDINKDTETNLQFPELLAKHMHRNDNRHHNNKILRELLLCKAQEKLDTQPLLCGG